MTTQHDITTALKGFSSILVTPFNDDDTLTPDRQSLIVEQAMEKFRSLS